MTVWTRSIDVAISRLRRKLYDNALEPFRIKTVRNKGYLFANARQRCNNEKTFRPVLPVAVRLFSGDGDAGRLVYKVTPAAPAASRWTT